MTKTTYPVEFRRKFVEGWARHEGTFDVYCSLFGVSRETGYEWRARFEAYGRVGLDDLSSAPGRCPHETPLAIQEFVIAARKLHPTWGARKLRPWLLESYPNLVLPAPSTIGDILDRNGLVLPRKRRHHTPPSKRPFVVAEAPNDVWTVDFKGQFRMQDQRLCYPLTLADAFSRYLLRCDAYHHPTEVLTRRSFLAAFREYGLPRVIHSDNGVPFASTAPGGLSRLSVWWVHLGILPERSAPARPADNGRHERMHRTLKAEATQPPRAHLASQQRTFSRFQREFNQDRPHQALGQEPPARHYATSPRPYPRRLPEITYSDQHDVRLVNSSGHIKWRGKSFFVTEVLSGEPVGVLNVSDDAGEVHFGPILLGTINHPRSDLGLIRPPKK